MSWFLEEKQGLGTGLNLGGKLRVRDEHFKNNFNTLAKDIQMKPEAWDQIIKMAEKHNITWLGLDQNGLTLLLEKKQLPVLLAIFS